MKKWVFFYLSTLMVIIISIISFNYWMDPFWCFSHNHKYNSIQKGTNERQQKANNVYFTEKKFDTLLLGSSRTTYLNQTLFNGKNVFNFSALGMRPKEYKTYIDFVINDCKQPIKNIIIAADFFGYLDYGLFMFNNAGNIVDTTKSPLYKYKALLSFDAFNTSFKNIRDNLKGRSEDRYNRRLVKVRNYKEHTKDSVLNGVDIYSRTEYSGKPNSEYKKLLTDIKSQYPDINFIIYTTPITEPLFDKMIEMNHYENYENWIKDLIDIYGNITHFMYINSITSNYLITFTDENHAYSETNDLIVYKLNNEKNTSIPSDFGIKIDKDNINSQLNILRKINKVKE